MRILLSTIVLVFFIFEICHSEITMRVVIDNEANPRTATIQYTSDVALDDVLNTASFHVMTGSDLVDAVVESPLNFLSPDGNGLVLPAPGVQPIMLMPGVWTTAVVYSLNAVVSITTSDFVINPTADEADPLIAFMDLAAGGPVATAPVGTFLPISLLSFEAQKGDSEVYLDWKTASEASSSHFDLERSIDAYNWSKIAEVEAQGESQIIQDYTYTDREINHLISDRTTIYYRLNMVDLDGAAELSPIRSVIFDQDAQLDPSLLVFPNPTSDYISVQGGGIVFDELTIYSYTGQVMYYQKYPERLNNIVLDTRQMSLESGSYFIKINTNNKEDNIHPFVVMK